MSSGRRRGRGGSGAGSRGSLSQSQTQPMDTQDEDYEDSTQGGLTQGSSRKAFEQMDSSLQKDKIASMVRYLLCHQGKRYPLKRKDLMDSLGEHKRAFRDIFEQANKRLIKGFGLKAVEIHRSGLKAGQAVATPIASSRSYVIVSTDALGLRHERSNAEHAEMGLLFIVLSLILMRQGSISDDQLWNCLSKLEITEKPHAIFGDVKRLIMSDFVNQMYLEKEKVVAGDKHSFTFRWGGRAEVEVDKEGMLKFVAETYGGEFEKWKRQFGSVLGGQSESSSPDDDN